MTTQEKKAYAKKYRAENRQASLAYQTAYRAECRKAKAQKRNLPIWELDRNDECSPDVFATLTRDGRSAYCMLREPEREEYVIADSGLVDDPAGWEILERLYETHGATVVFWGRLGHSWMCRYRHESEWGTMPSPVRRMAGLVAAMKAVDDCSNLADKM